MITTKDLLSKLKNPTEQEAIFKSFLNKHRNTIEKVVDIQFSDEKYQAIDVTEIFYDNFLKYTIKQLELCDKTTSIDCWVIELAQKRAEDIHAKVVKSCAKYFLQTGGRENWDKFNLILRDEVFASTIGNIIKRYFDNRKYGGYYNDIKDELLLHLYLDRLDKPSPIEKEIENILSYVYGMFRSIAVSKREVIDLELGIRDNSADAAIYGRTEADEPDYTANHNEEDNQDTQEDSNDKHNGDEGCDMNDEVDQDDNYETNEERLSEDTHNLDNSAEAEHEIEKYLNLMHNKKQAELLRMVMFERDREKLAARMGCSRANLDNKVSQAMTRLYEVSLPYIKNRCKQMVTIHKDELTDEYQKSILIDFFNSNKSLTELAKEYYKKSGDFTEDLIRAYKKVKSISDKTYEKTKKRAYTTDKDIAKYAEQELKLEAKSTLIYLNRKSNENK